MSLTKQDIERINEVLDRTNMHKNAPEKVIPEDYKSYLSKVMQEEKIIDLPAPCVPVRVVISTALDKLPDCPIHVNFHGGGFIHGQDKDDDLYCAHLAAEIRGIVVDVDYATSDQHPYPMAFNQSYAIVRMAYEKATDLGADPARLSIGGSSAGGCLAAAIMLKNARQHDFPLCLVVLEYAANDNWMPYQFAEDPHLERSRAFSEYYVGGELEKLREPYCSPAFAEDEELENLPHTLFIAPAKCPFYETNQRLAVRMMEQGNEVSYHAFLDSMHGSVVRMTGEWREAQDVVIRYIKNA
jgi:acetyl esterase